MSASNTSARARSTGIAADQAAQLLDRALIVPVLTAHPTEVMRKSMIDHRNRIADLMRLRDQGLSQAAGGEEIEQSLLRQIALLWQTRPLRRERIIVADEVEIALAYLRDIFLPVLPMLYARWERNLPQRPRSFLRLGSWIGGDRDGNPNVNAATLDYALGRSAAAVLENYLQQLNGLGAELSISSELATPNRSATTRACTSEFWRRSSVARWKPKLSTARTSRPSAPPVASNPAPCWASECAMATRSVRNASGPA